MIKTHSRILALLLTLTLLVQLFSGSVFAEPEEADPAGEPGASENGTAEPEVAAEPEGEDENAPDPLAKAGKPSTVVVGEVTALRAETQKHFRMEDGSYIAVDYGIPVHYTEDDGESWEEIDNTLTLDRSGEAAKYTAENGSSTRSFAQNLQSGFLFSAGSSEHQLGFSLSPMTDNTPEGNGDDSAEHFNTEAAAQISYPAAEKKTRGDEPSEDGETPSIADQVQPSKLCADVLYQNVFDGVDLSYELYSYNVKENIIVNQPRDSYSFTFDLSVGNLTPVLEDDGSVALLDNDNQPVYLIPAPYMLDAAGASSDAVSYTLSQEATGDWSLTIAAASDWINAADRAFPVVIDPTIIDKELWTSDSAFGVTYVVSGEASQSHQNYQEVYFGYNEGTYHHQVFIGWDQLPTVPAGSEVVNAQLYMYQDYYTNVGVLSFHGELHEVPNSPANISNKGSYTTNKAWITSRTWNNKPSDVSNTVLDYTTIGLSTKYSYSSWDMTGMVKQWYASNPSIKAAALYMTESGTCNSSHYGMAGFRGYGYSTGPLFVVSYRNLIGVEPYYTYQALGAGNAGAAYISDYTGNLTTVTPLVGYASGVNPFSLNLVYNSAYFADTGVDNAAVAADLGYGMYMGSGMKLDLLQKVEKVTLQYEYNSMSTKEYIKYTDGDGTEHYFAQDFSKDATGSYYYDEDGLGLKVIEYATDYYRMEDDKGNKLVFANGFLLWKEDANGNKIQLYFEHSNGTHASNWYPVSGDRLKYIKQINSGESAITVATFTYGSHNGVSNYLSTITDAAGNIYQFNYECFKLRFVKRKLQGEQDFTDFVTFKHPYDSSTSRYINPVTELTDNKGNYTVHFDYTDRRVSKYYEKGGSTQGASATIQRSPGEKTTYIDWGNNRIENDSDDISTTYLFDYAARTVNAYTTDNSGAILGASNAVNTGTGNTDKQNNRTLRSAGIGMAGMSLCRNGGFELTDSSVAWTLDTPSGSNAVISSGEKARTGSKSLKTWIGSSGTGITGAHRYAEQLSSTQKYTASVYVNTSAATSFGNKGIYLKVVDSYGSYTPSEYLNYKTDTTIDDGWVRLSYTFQPSHAGNQTVYICNEGVKGAVYFDDFQLEKGDAPSNVNLLENGGLFSTNYGWKTESNGNPSLPSSQGGIQGSYAFSVTGSPTADKYIWQTVTVNQPGTQTYVLSGWGKANAVPDNVTTATGDDKLAKDTNKQFGLRAILTYSDSTTEYHYVPFCADLTVWQFASLAIVPKESTKTVSTIKVVCAYEKNANTAYFDNLSLVKEVAQTMAYDADGNLTSVKSTGTNADENTYNNGNLTQVVTGGNGTFTYTYDNNHNLQTAKNSVVKETYTYDSAGNVESSALTKAEGTPSASETINSSKTYTNSKNLVLTSIAANGCQTAYTYGSDLSKMLGAATKVTDPKSTSVVTNYLYDGKVASSWISNNVSVYRTYSNELLTRLERGGYNTHGSSPSTKLKQYYNFTYDAFGNTTAISVGGTDLQNPNYPTYYNLGTYTYAPRDGLLTCMTYGNGATVSYTYDKVGRKTEVTTSAGDSYNYSYTGDGQLYKMTDNAGTSSTSDDLIYGYNYDTIGRLIGSTLKTGSTMQLQTRHEYDANNRLFRQSWVLPGKTYKEKYVYDTGNGRLTGKEITLPTDESANITLTYDNLSRTNSVSTPAATTSYSYASALYGTGTTGLVYEQTTSSVHTGSNVFARLKHRYSYDALGNITKIQELDPNGTVVNTIYYTYDIQSQLTQASSTTAGSWTYQYDTFGNIRKKTRNGIDYNYTYANTNWQDMLTSISVKSGNTTLYSGSFTYDGAGNPTSYYNLNAGSGETWSLTWRNGRELSAAQSATWSISYDYDANGIRTYKIVDGVRHDYTYASGQLLREQYTQSGTTYTLDFLYDQASRPYMLYLTTASGNSSTSTPYYYILNLQGDVIHLVNTSGVAVASYSYDPFGDILSSSGTNNLHNINPLRYRGYYYDDETGWYYLQSRYYDPALGRFINADSYSSTGQGFLGYNMFAYCGNNPVIRDDSSGEGWFDSLVKAVAVVAVVVTAAVLVTVATAATGGAALAAATVAFGAASGGLVGGFANEAKGESFAKGWVGGAVNGTIQSSLGLLHPAGTIIGGGIGSAVGTYITENLNNSGKPKSEQKTSEQIKKDSIRSGIVGTATSTLTAFMGNAVKEAVPTKANGLMPSLTTGFGKMISGFFGAVDDAITYMLS